VLITSSTYSTQSEGDIPAVLLEQVVLYTLEIGEHTMERQLQEPQTYITKEPTAEGAGSINSRMQELVLVLDIYTVIDESIHIFRWFDHYLEKEYMDTKVTFHMSRPIGQELKRGMCYRIEDLRLESKTGLICLDGVYQSARLGGRTLGDFVQEMRFARTVQQNLKLRTLGAALNYLQIITDRRLLYSEAVGHKIIAPPPRARVSKHPDGMYSIDLVTVKDEEGLVVSQIYFTSKSDRWYSEEKCTPTTDCISLPQDCLLHSIKVATHEASFEQGKELFHPLLNKLVARTGINYQAPVREYCPTLACLDRELILNSDIGFTKWTLQAKYNLIPLKLQRALDKWYQTYEAKLNLLRQEVKLHEPESTGILAL